MRQIHWFTAILIVLTLSYYFGKENFVRATVPPIANNITITSTTGGQYISNFNLIEDSTSNIYLRGSFTDGDGCNDVNLNGEIDAVLYRSSLVDAEKCHANNYSCYRGKLTTGDCVVTGCDAGDEIVAYYECSLPVEYYADATDVGPYVDDNWVGYIEIKDGSSATSSVQNGVEINSLAAISFNGLLNYGIMSLGATSSIQTIQIRNVGNVTTDLTISGTDMLCSSGKVPIANQHYSLVSTTTYENSQPIGLLATVAEINLPKFNGNASVANVYFQVQMATSSIAGTCNGNTTLGAIMDN